MEILNQFCIIKKFIWLEQKRVIRFTCIQTNLILKSSRFPWVDTLAEFKETLIIETEGSFSVNRTLKKTLDNTVQNKNTIRDRKITRLCTYLSDNLKI